MGPSWLSGKDCKPASFKKVRARRRCAIPAMFFVLDYRVFFLLKKGQETNKKPRKANKYPMCGGSLYGASWWHAHGLFHLQMFLGEPQNRWFFGGPPKGDSLCSINPETKCKQHTNSNACSGFVQSAPRLIGFRMSNMDLGFAVSLFRLKPRRHGAPLGAARARALRHVTHRSLEIWLPARRGWSLTPAAPISGWPRSCARHPKSTWTRKRGGGGKEQMGIHSHGKRRDEVLVYCSPAKIQCKVTRGSVVLMLIFSSGSVPFACGLQGKPKGALGPRPILTRRASVCEASRAPQPSAKQDAPRCWSCFLFILGMPSLVWL